MPSHRRYLSRFLNPKFIEAAHNNITPRYLQARHAGFLHTPHLSYLLHTPRRIAVTPLMRQRLERLAGLLEFPADEVFLNEPEEQAVQR